MNYPGQNTEKINEPSTVYPAKLSLESKSELELTLPPIIFHQRKEEMYQKERERRQKGGT